MNQQLQIATDAAAKKLREEAKQKNRSKRQRRVTALKATVQERGFDPEDPVYGKHDGFVNAEDYLRIAEAVGEPGKDAEVEYYDPSTETGKRKISRFFQGSYLKPEEDFFKERLAVCWRVIRYVGKSLGYLTEDLPLSMAFVPDASGLDKWTVPPIPDISMECRGANREVVMAARRACALGKEDLVWRYDFEDENDDVRYYEGLPVLPPPVPFRYMNTDGTVKESYDPRQDKLLKLFLDAHRTACLQLQVSLGTLEDPGLGNRGMLGLFDPGKTRILYPSKYELMAYEALLVEQTLELFISEGGDAGAKREMRKRYGLTAGEAAGLLKLAYLAAKQERPEDVEELRAMTLLRIEDLATRSKNSGSMRTELQALKLMVVVAGITKAEPEDAATAFTKVAKAVMGDRALIKQDDAVSIEDMEEKILTLTVENA